ncbi:ABC transporter ATP-binding protein [Metabacillus sp. HB246100]
MAFLDAENVSFAYPDETEKVLHNLSFTVERGEFIVLCGPSGSGKSTLLRLLKREIAPHGVKEGEIRLDNHLISHSHSSEQLIRDIGMVFQDPENQIVMEHVLDELVFGLENMGATTEEMRKKVAEIVHFFGIESLLHRKTHELSGGQKQLVNLASVLLLEPKLLLLDEPTAQLDPIAAREFIAMLQTMNEEFGMTIIIAEHRLEELFGLADKALFLEKGELVIYDTPRNVIGHIGGKEETEMVHYLPSSARLFLEQDRRKRNEQIPLSVKEGKQWLNGLEIAEKQQENEQQASTYSKPFMSLTSVDFQYSKSTPKILQDLSLSIFEGEWLSIVGANGTGKSTLLKVMAGLLKPQRGSILFDGKKLKKQQPKQIGYLPQNPKLFFVHETIEEELKSSLANHNIVDPKKWLELMEIFQLEQLLNRHPYDVSGGEIQKAALAGVMLANPKLLLIDEPTKGLDPAMKRQFGQLLKHLQHQGVTIVMVTHDIEFAALFSTRCAMMFQGEITMEAPSKTFFSGNAFYTTVCNRITRGSHAPEIVTVEEARGKWDVLG